MKNPPFELTNQIVSDVAEIAELVGRLTSTDRLSDAPSLCRRKRQDRLAVAHPAAVQVEPHIRLAPCGVHRPRPSAGVL